jgi:hypothetical protein
LYSLKKKEHALKIYTLLLRHSGLLITNVMQDTGIQQTVNANDVRAHFVAPTMGTTEPPRKKDLTA